MAIFNIDNSSLNSYLNENNKAFKHIADIESRINPYENRSSKQIQSDIKKKVPTQTKKIINRFGNSDEGLKKLHNMIKNGNNEVAIHYKKYRGAAGQYLAKKASNKLAGYTGAELKRRGFDPKTGEKLREAAEYILSVLDESEKKITYDKVKYHIDGGEDKSSVIKRFKIIFNFLKDNSFLNDKGLEELSLGISEETILNSDMCTDKGNKYLSKNYSKIEKCETNNLNKFMKSLL